MSVPLKLTVAALAALSAVACASSPKQATAPAAKTAPASAAPAAATSAPAAANTSEAADVAARAALQVNPKLLVQGYKPVKVKNEYVYCRMEAVTGTQFKKRVCLTEAAIHDLEQRTQETQD